MRIKLRTVNVIEVRNGVVDSIRSFAEGKKGNHRAEAEFRRQIRARKDGALYDADEIESMLDDGVFDDGQRHQIYLTHSV
jgi:hypothetical protein